MQGGCRFETAPTFSDGIVVSPCRNRDPPAEDLSRDAWIVRAAMRDLLSKRRTTCLEAGIRFLGILPVFLSLAVVTMAETGDAPSQPAGSRRRPIAEMPAPSSTGAHTSGEPSVVKSVDGIPELTFRDLFRASPGTGGLEITERAQALAGKPVRLRGYMVRQSQPIPWAFILSPVPQSLHEREYGECDDLPVTAIHVFLPRSSPPIPTRLNGPVTVTGVLELGGREEADGRVSPARIRITGPVSTALVAASVPRVPATAAR
jgi:hypothetical protein